MSVDFDNQLVSKEKVAINFSTAKQMYSFGKASRFKEMRTTNEKFFYDLPSTKSTRKAGIGIGTKSDFTKGKLKGKADRYYDMPSCFDVFRRNSPQYSFGRGREVCKLPSELAFKKNPGPGTYEPYHKFGSDAKKFSLFGRTWSKPKRLQTEPGPGQYKYLNINLSGKYPSSLYRNIPDAGFSHYKSQRFSTRDLRNPSPDTYFKGNLQFLMTGTGFYYSTKHKSDLGKTFSPRLYMKTPVERQAFPGPGSYDYFSDFNGYNRNIKLGSRSLSKPDIKSKSHRKNFTEGNEFNLNQGRYTRSTASVFENTKN